VEGVGESEGANMNDQTELERLKSAARDTDGAARAAWDAWAAAWAAATAAWAAARESTRVATAAADAWKEAKARGKK
jgi:hypothetical protein